MIVLSFNKRTKKGACIFVIQWNTYFRGNGSLNCKYTCHDFLGSSFKVFISSRFMEWHGMKKYSWKAFLLFPHVEKIEKFARRSQEMASHDLFSHKTHIHSSKDLFLSSYLWVLAFKFTYKTFVLLALNNFRQIVYLNCQFLYLLIYCLDVVIILFRGQVSHGKYRTRINRTNAICILPQNTKAIIDCYLLFFPLNILETHYPIIWQNLLPFQNALNNFLSKILSTYQISYCHGT